MHDMNRRSTKVSTFDEQRLLLGSGFGPVLALKCPDWEPRESQLSCAFGPRTDASACKLQTRSVVYMHNRCGYVVMEVRSNVIEVKNT